MQVTKPFTLSIPPFNANQAERAQKAVEDIQKEVSEVARDNPGAMAAFRRMMGGA